MQDTVEVGTHPVNFHKWIEMEDVWMRQQMRLWNHGWVGLRRLQLAWSLECSTILDFIQHEFPSYKVGPQDSVQLVYNYTN